MSFLSALFGSKPSVPSMPVTTLTGSQQGAIGANQAALPSAENLVGAANQFSTSQITQMLNAAIPGYSNMAATAGANIQSELSGQIPTDVSQAVQTADAAKSLASGTAGSSFAGNLTARDLGLTSLDLTQQGLNSAQSWMKTAASIYEPSQMNLQSMFISPMQAYQTGNQQAEQQFQQQWMSSQVAAMPDPGVRGIYDTTMTILGEAMSAYGGGSGYNSSNVAGGAGSDTSTAGMNFGGFNDFGGEMGLGNFG